MKKRLLMAGLVLGSMVSVSAFAHGKHVHGEAEMEVALEGNELAIGISGPLANFLGFEHAPKDERQKKALIDMTGDLHEGGRLFELNAEAACSFTSSQVAVRKGGKRVNPIMLQTLGGTEKDGHADMDASYVFSCKKPDALKSITVRLFTRFPGLTELDVQMVLPKKQMSAELTPKKPQLSW
ncbi:MAG: DUF2796 domain-containing protein [Oxalobacter sp.]|nr:DUF2796 domain-containing protein [Oxalobacter sp.]